MSRRLPAPPPRPPRPETGAPGPDRGDPPPGDPDRSERAPDPERDPEADDDLDPLDEDWADDPLDPELLDSDAWPDDLDEPTVPDNLLERELEELPALDDVGDDGVEEDFELPADDPPLEDDLDDLDAPDDTESTILPWTLTVSLDGRQVQATVDPLLERTLWSKPRAVPGTKAVRLLVAGHALILEVDCAPSDAEAIRLGRDVLSGRFLLRP